MSNDTIANTSQELEQINNALEQINNADAHTARVQRVLKNFRIIFKSVQRHSAMVETECGLSGSQLWALWELLMSPGLKVSDLSKVMSIHQSTASNLLDKLEKRELVKRERRGPDQRVVRLFLTPEGLKIINRAPRPAQGVLNHTLLRLPDKALESLETGLTEIVANMNLKDESAALKPLTE
jgi:MarR family transcriptional regulator, organic hydroperoxide resistance regulator